MKIWFNKIPILCLLSLALLSCEKDEDKVSISVGEAPTLAASATSVVLVEADADETALTMTWDPLNLTWSDQEVSHSDAVNYILQFDTQADNFASPEEVEVGNSLQKAFTHAELNALLNRLELEPGQAGEVVVRLFPMLADNLTPAYSNTLSLSLTPWLDKPKFATVYMVGDATENDWDNMKGTPMFRSEANPFLFTFTGNLEAGALKFLQTPGLWAPQWGSDGTATGVAFRATDADADPGSFTVPANGYYTVTLNLRNMTFALTPYDASGAATYSSIGIIGVFNDWVNVVPMTKTSLNPHVWSIEYTFAQSTELKFRKAENWDANWGAGDNATDIYGQGYLNSDNISIAAGTYRIIFNDLTGNYVFIKK